MPTFTAKQVVIDLLDQHRMKPNSLTCKALDWTYDGDNDFDEHQADQIVAALRSAGFIDQTTTGGNNDHLRRTHQGS